MMSVDIAAFLAPLEPLSHAERVRIMIELGKQSVHDNDAQAIIDSLEQQGFFERYLAMYSCFGSRDSVHVMRSLSDPSKIIRGLAIRLIVQLGDAEQLQVALQDFPRLRFAIAVRLRQLGRTPIIVTFLEHYQVNGTPEDDDPFYTILPMGNAGVVSRHLAAFRDWASMHDWRRLRRLARLARFHPDIAVDVLDLWSQESIYTSTMITCFNVILPVVVLTQSERVVAIIQRFLQQIPISEIHIMPLLIRQPEAIVDLLLILDIQVTYNLRNALAGVIATLRDDQVERLLARDTQSFGYYGKDWLAGLPIERRTAIFTTSRQLFEYQLSNRQNEKVVSEKVLELLPSEIRVREALQILNNNRLGEERLWYAYLLPWHEMLPFITDYLHSAKIEHRKMALKTIVDTVRFHRTNLADALELLQERRMEADIMRRDIFHWLCLIPSSVWQSEHLSGLSEIIQHGLRDVGLSVETRKAMLQLVSQLLPRHTDWAIEATALIVHERGFAQPDKQRVDLTTAQEERLAIALVPILAIWQRQEKEDQILDSIAYYLPHYPLSASIITILQTILQETRSRDTFERILKLMSKHNFEDVISSLPTMLIEDMSLITFERIADYLFYRRQDLLSPFLNVAIPQGRFSSGRQRYLPRLSRSFAGGSTQQQMQYLQLARSIIADMSTDVQMTLYAIKQLAYLPAVGVDAIRDFANQDNSLIRTTALFTLSRLDTDDGLSILIEALQDSRARIAIVVLRPFLRRMSTSSALATLKAVPMNRVAVSKEIVRLISSVGGDDALLELLALERQELHKDVQLTLVKELWSYQTNPGVAEVFTRVAQSPDDDLAIEAIPPFNPWGINHELVRTLTVEYMRVLALMLQHPSQRVQERAVNACQNIINPDSEGACIAQLFTFVEQRRGDRCFNPAKSLFFLGREQEHPAIMAMLQSKIPDRESLQHVVKALKNTSNGRRPDISLLYRQFLAELARDPLTVDLQIELAGNALDRDEFIQFLRTLVDTNALHARAVMAIGTVIDRSFQRFTLDDLVFMETALMENTDERLRYIAFTLLKEQSERARQWSSDRVERLKKYRDDVSLLVASEAQFLFPSGQDVSG